MKNAITICLMIISLTIIASCQKEYDSDIEIIESELIEFVNANNITTCTIALLTDDGYTITHQNVNFSIKNGLIIVHDTNTEYRYNLIHLITYNLVTYPEKMMYLYFQ